MREGEKEACFLLFPFPRSSGRPPRGGGGNVRSGNVNEKVLCVRRKYELQLYVCHKKIKKNPFSK